MRRHRPRSAAAPGALYRVPAAGHQREAAAPGPLRADLHRAGGVVVGQVELVAAHPVTDDPEVPGAHALRHAALHRPDPNPACRVAGGAAEDAAVGHRVDDPADLATVRRPRQLASVAVPLMVIASM